MDYQDNLNRLRELVYQRSFEFGDFVLTSGKRSSYYFDGKQVTLQPEGAYLIAKIILQKIADCGATAIGGLTLGADPMAGAIAAVAHTEGFPELKLFIVRKTAKAHGKQKRIEGPVLVPGEKVVVVDDVITTGGSIIEAIEAAREIGCEVVKAIALVDRLEGGREKIQAMGIEVDPIFTIKDFLQ